jgi:hypothetical protein
MPTYERDPRFIRDFSRLSLEERRAFRAAVVKFLEDLPSRRFRAGLRIRDVEGRPGIWEMTWASDGRATFSYGPEVRPGEPHVVWRRIGDHGIFRDP